MLKFLGLVFGGVNKLIGLIDKSGDAFIRLTPHVAVVTCTFLLGAFALVAGFVLCHLLALALACTCSAFAEPRYTYIPFKRVSAQCDCCRADGSLGIHLLSCTHRESLLGCSTTRMVGPGSDLAAEDLPGR